MAGHQALARFDRELEQLTRRIEFLYDQVSALDRGEKRVDPTVQVLEGILRAQRDLVANLRVYVMADKGFAPGTLRLGEG